jgi:hypothetical protein
MAHGVREDGRLRPPAADAGGGRRPPPLMSWRDLSLAASRDQPRTAIDQVPLRDPPAERLGVLSGDLTKQAVEGRGPLVCVGDHP